jgi:hypothetical protein
MKEPWDWKESDLLALINSGEKESLTLDYKECAALANTDGKKSDIGKHVSAFANSAGGTLVYGMKENGHVPTELDEGFDPNVISKEWLEQVINSNIQRRIDGIRINAVDLSTTHPRRVAYVVHIPQSMRAPHQAADHKFYKRYNFESKPMEEYEIRDVGRRSESPTLSVIFKLPDERVRVDSGNAFKITPLITNEAATPAEYAVIDVLLDTRLEVEYSGAIQREEETTITFRGIDVMLRMFQFYWMVPPKMPIWEGAPMELFQQPLSVKVPTDGNDFLLGWRIRSPRTTVRGGLTMLHVQGRWLQPFSLAEGVASSLLKSSS